MTVKDRTQEFHAVVESLQNRSSTTLFPAEKSRLLSNAPTLSKSEFARAASAIATEIAGMSAKLSKLTTLAKKKSLFDDRPLEINELIYVIKQDIAKVNKQISQLGEYLSRTQAAASGSSMDPSVSAAVGNAQSSEHSKQVLSYLQTRLAHTSNDFKEILEIRTANMKEQKTRRDQYASGESSSLAPLSSDSPLYHPEKRVGYTSDLQRGDTIIDLGGLQQSQQLMTSSSLATTEYMESRSQAIESIESTIAELGQIYQNFATLLAGQREMVQRIDDNIMDMQVNVEGAHGQLAKYYSSISSNRMLMVKIFAVLIAFFMAFVLMS